MHIILENVEIPVSLNPEKNSLEKSYPMMVQPVKRGSSPKRLFQHIAREVTDMQKMGLNEEKKKEWLSMELINTFFKIMLPLATTIFNIVYFIRTNHHNN